MPSYQGKLDSLCGPYAIVNALEQCDVENADSFFQIACSALAAKRWPSVLWLGTNFYDLQKMIAKCLRHQDICQRINAKYPFMKNTPKTNAEYWNRFDDLHTSNPNIRCAIIGMKKPNEHWVVAQKKASETRIIFSDSEPFEPTRRRNRAKLYAGHRRPDRNSLLFERAELVLFEVL